MRKIFIIGNLPEGNVIEIAIYPITAIQITLASPFILVACYELEKDAVEKLTELITEDGDRFFIMELYVSMDDSIFTETPDP